ncbi:MAG: hypothetical protein U0703_25685 [Anaerolineae bacterium]
MLQTAKALGCRVLLVIEESLRDQLALAKASTHFTLSLTCAAIRT